MSVNETKTQAAKKRQTQTQVIPRKPTTVKHGNSCVSWINIEYRRNYNNSSR